MNCCFGILEPSNFTCATQPCDAPGHINDAAAQACFEGAQVSSGSVCTAHCVSGRVPTEVALNCGLGIFSPPSFDCFPEPCAIPTNIARLAAQPCVGVESSSDMVSDEVCVVACDTGYSPTVAQLNCSFGAFEPPHSIGAAAWSSYRGGVSLLDLLILHCVWSCSRAPGIDYST